MLRTVLAAASAVLICGSGPALATPFTLDDMLRIEQFGQVSLSPQETTVAFERIGPTLGAGPYEYDALDLVLRSQILVAPSDGHTAPRPLLPEVEGRGHVIGAWSPDDRRLLVYRLRDRTFTAGIADTVTGEVEWLSGTPESAMWGRSAQWRNGDDLVMIQRADGDLPAGAAGLPRPGTDEPALAVDPRGTAARAHLDGRRRFSGPEPQTRGLAPGARLCRLGTATAPGDRPFP